MKDMKKFEEKLYHNLQAYIMLPDKIVYLTKKSNNILQLQTTISFKMNTFNMNCAINYLKQDMYHLCSKNTIPSKH